MLSCRRCWRHSKGARADTENVLPARMISPRCLTTPRLAGWHAPPATCQCCCLTLAGSQVSALCFSTLACVACFIAAEQKSVVVLAISSWVCLCRRRLLVAREFLKRQHMCWCMGCPCICVVFIREVAVAVCQTSSPVSSRYADHAWEQAWRCAPADVLHIVVLPSSWQLPTMCSTC